MISILQKKYDFDKCITSSSLFSKRLNKMIKCMDLSLINSVLDSETDVFKGFEYNIIIDSGELNYLFNSNDYNNQYYKRILISKLDDELNEINVSILEVDKYIILKKDRINYIDDDKTCVCLFYKDDKEKVHMYCENSKKVKKSKLGKMRVLKKEIACI